MVLRPLRLTMCRRYCIVCLFCKRLVQPWQLFTYGDRAQRLLLEERDCENLYCDFKQGKVVCNDQMCGCSDVQILSVNCCFILHDSPLSTYVIIPDRGRKSSSVCNCAQCLLAEWDSAWDSPLNLVVPYYDPVLTKAECLQTLVDHVSFADIGHLWRHNTDARFCTDRHKLYLLSARLAVTGKVSFAVLAYRLSGETRPQLYLVSAVVLLALTYWHSRRNGRTAVSHSSQRNIPLRRFLRKRIRYLERPMWDISDGWTDWHHDYERFICEH